MGDCNSNRRDCQRLVSDLRTEIIIFKNHDDPHDPTTVVGYLEQKDKQRSKQAVRQPKPRDILAGRTAHSRQRIPPSDQNSKTGPLPMKRQVPESRNIQPQPQPAQVPTRVSVPTRRGPMSSSEYNAFEQRMYDQARIR